MTTNTTQAAAMTQDEAIHMLRATMCAIAQTLNDGELRKAAREAYDSTAAAPAQAQPSTEQMVDVILKLIGAGVMDWKAGPTGDPEEDAFHSDDEERRALIDAVNSALATRTAGSATPVAQEVHQFRRRLVAHPWYDAPRDEAYARVDDFFEARTLYTIPIAPAAAKWPDACQWPEDKPFRVLKVGELGDHTPWQIVMPCGGVLELNHHADDAVDEARAKWIGAALNQPQEDWSSYLKDDETPLVRLRREIDDSDSLLSQLANERSKSAPPVAEGVDTAALQQILDAVQSYYTDISAGGRTKLVEFITTYGAQQREVGAAYQARVFDKVRAHKDARIAELESALATQPAEGLTDEAVHAEMRKSNPNWNATGNSREGAVMLAIKSCRAILAQQAKKGSAA
jgi:hypothetical protein